MALDEQVAALEGLGFTIVSREDHEVVATRGKWYWDCFFTHLTFVVFLKATGSLSASDIAGEVGELVDRAKGLDLSSVPLGLQHGIAVVPAYVAERVEADAQELCTSPYGIKLAMLAYPAALDLSTDQAYFRKTRIWGGMYYGKLRHLAAQLLQPASASSREPLSVLGLVLTCLLIGVPVVSILIMVASAA